MDNCVVVVARGLDSYPILFPSQTGAAVLNFDVEVVSVNGATADAGSGLSEAHQAQAEGVLNKVNTLLRSNPDSFLDDSDDPLYK